MSIIHFTHRFVRLAISAATVALVTATAVSAQRGATYEIVSSFDSADGRPTALLQARNGQFYGTSAPAMQTSAGKLGTLFAMDETGSRTTLHTFLPAFPNNFEGAPVGNLFEGIDGSVYGTTYVFNNFVAQPGQIFRITPDGAFTTFVAHVVHRMNSIMQARDGRFWGTAGPEIDQTFAIGGGIFTVEADGTLSGSGTTTQFNPSAQLVEIDDGSLYGVNAGDFLTTPAVSPHGEIFRRGSTSPGPSHVFSGPDGSRPFGRLLQGADGLIYGTTSRGGLHNLGTVFSFDAAGTLTTLHHFSGADGATPGTGVTQGLDGRLYGTTSGGGALGYGTVFVMNVSGGLTTLHDFALTDGSNPNSELIQAQDGAFYGTAFGGPDGGGVIFRIRLGTSPPDQFVEIVSRNSGKCLDVSGASTDAAAPAIQWTCHGGLNQQWRLEPAGGGAFRIIARHSGQALDVSGASLDDVAPIIQWPVHGGDNQAWTPEPASDGYVRLVVRHSGKAMDVEFASQDDGARVIQYSPHDGANQQWLLRAVEATAAPVTAVSAR